ncbi:MAG TPA: lysozyme [Solirubrobacterales bacterium]
MSLRYAVIDGCPCPRPLYPILKKLKKETGCVYNSIYRGDDVAGILHKFGKHTQRELYEELPPGMANPPDRGTHILRGDGVVGKLFAKLRFWQCGIDVDDQYVEALIEAARRHGWKLYRPYSSGSEYHHLNFASKPRRWKAFFRHVFGAPKVVGVAPAKPAPKKPVKHHAKPPVHPHPTRLSEAGVKFIAGFEGFRAEAYWDPWGNVWTIAFGHTGPDVHQGEKVGRAKGLKLLRSDAATAAQAVKDLVDVELTQKQFDALVSFAYNLGGGALAESTLLKMLNRGNYKGAQQQFKRWTHAGGQELPGLVRRRAAEARLFGGGDYA